MASIARVNVVRVIVSSDGTRRVVEKSNLPIHKAMVLRDKLEDKVMKEDWAPESPIVSYVVEGIV